MIFIPKKEDCVTWNQVEDGVLFILIMERLKLSLHWLKVKSIMIKGIL